MGSLTVLLHNAWADAAIEWIAQNHPEIELVGERYGVAENVDGCRTTALDLIAANPDLKGFLAFGSQGPIGAGRAIEERRLAGQVLPVFIALIILQVLSSGLNLLGANQHLSTAVWGLLLIGVMAVRWAAGNLPFLQRDRAP